MAEEIELKLTLNIRTVPLLKQHPRLASLPFQKRCLRNIYLDTPEQALKSRRIAVRRRQIGTQWLLTIKTDAPESSTAGLSRRMEWEFPMPPDQLDFSSVDIAPIRELLISQADSLQQSFSTDFVRTSWEIQQGDSTIELALDLGYIRTAHHRAPICELELELLTGSEAALTSLAQELQQPLSLTPFSLSKAARGYALLKKYHP